MVSGTAQAATPAESAAAGSVFSMLNSERGANGLPALAWSPALVSSARSHNIAMDRANVLSHQLPGEPDLGTRISLARVPWHQVAENIGYNTDRTSRGADALEFMMYSEKPPTDGHRRNILSVNVRYVGVDVLIGNNGKLWLTEDFADASGPTPAVAQPSLALHNPRGYYDSLIPLPGHRALVTGWAADPDNLAVPLKIAVYADGRGLGWFASGVARPDVARLIHTGPRQGFSIAVLLGPGRHSVCTYAINIGAGTANTALGCRVVTT